MASGGVSANVVCGVRQGAAGAMLWRAKERLYVIGVLN